MCIPQATASSPTFSGVISVRGENFCAPRSPLKVDQSVRPSAAPARGEGEQRGAEHRPGSRAAVRRVVMRSSQPTAATSIRARRSWLSSSQAVRRCRGCRGGEPRTRKVTSAAAAGGAAEHEAGEQEDRGGGDGEERARRAGDVGGRGEERGRGEVVPDRDEQAEAGAERDEQAAVVSHSPSPRWFAGQNARGGGRCHPLTCRAAGGAG